MKVSRGTILARCLRFRCPDCGRAPLLRSFFYLQAECPHCGAVHGRESGFTLGTTSIGYVLALMTIVLPLIILAIRSEISFFIAVLAGGIGSFLFPLLLYPLLLCGIVGLYYTFLPGELSANRETETAQGGVDDETLV